MSTVFKDIKAALDVRLSTMTGLPSVAWQNTSYEPVLGTTYLRPTVLPGNTVGATLGSSGSDEHVGVYQIDIFTKAGIGRGVATVLTDTIGDHFKPVTELVYNAQTVRCVSVSIGAAREGDGWYQIPVDINYMAFTTKR